MSNLWVHAVEQESLPFTIDTRSALPKPGWTYEARVPASHQREGQGSLAGYVHVESKPDPSDPGGYLHHVHMIEVNPGYQRQGVGRALLEHTLQQAGYDNGVSHDGFTPDGAGLWESVTGEHVKPGQRSDQSRTRDWRRA